MSEPRAAPSSQLLLLVEDNPDDAALFGLELNKDPAGPAFRIQTVPTLNAALSVLWTNAVDAVLLDLALPDSFGLGTLELLLGEVPDVPVVVFTGLADDDAAVQAVTLGAEEYVVKGTPAPMVARVLVQAIARHRARRSSPAPDHSQAQAAMHDPLTGLPNRFLFVDRLRTTVARSRRYKDPFALLVLNTWSGLWEEDPIAKRAVIAETGRRLTAVTRRSDTVARLEEDVFGVIFERASGKARVCRYVASLVKSLERPIPIEGAELRARFQPGLAFFPTDGWDDASLLEVAVTNGVMLGV